MHTAWGHGNLAAFFSRNCPSPFSPLTPPPPPFSRAHSCHPLPLSRLKGGGWVEGGGGGLRGMGRKDEKSSLCFLPSQCVYFLCLFRVVWCMLLSCQSGFALLPPPASSPPLPPSPPLSVLPSVPSPPSDSLPLPSTSSLFFFLRLVPLILFLLCIIILFSSSFILVFLPFGVLLFSSSEQDNVIYSLFLPDLKCWGGGKKENERGKLRHRQHWQLQCVPTYLHMR